MHSLEFPVSLRYMIPEAKDPSLQNLYVFNMYRAGSSVLEAAAVGLSTFSGRVPINLTRDLYQLGVATFDVQNRSNSNLFASNEGADFIKLTQMGGYLHYGFREIPSGFAEAFNSLGASVLIVRDLRDIGLSHYRAIDTHTTDDSKITKASIENARKLKAGKDLHEYILTPELLGFLKRLGQCYKPLIQKGIQVIQYEELFDYSKGEFSVQELCNRLTETFEPYIGDFDSRALYQRTIQAIENSDRLSGHATSGGTGYYKTLPSDVLEKYTAALSDELTLLGYLD